MFIKTEAHSIRILSNAVVSGSCPMQLIVTWLKNIYTEVFIMLQEQLIGKCQLHVGIWI